MCVCVCLCVYHAVLIEQRNVCIHCSSKKQKTPLGNFILFFLNHGSTYHVGLLK